MTLSRCYRQPHDKLRRTAWEQSLRGCLSKDPLPARGGHLNNLWLRCVARCRCFPQPIGMEVGQVERSARNHCIDSDGLSGYAGIGERVVLNVLDYAPSGSTVVPATCSCTPCQAYSRLICSCPHSLPPKTTQTEQHIRLLVLCYVRYRSSGERSLDHIPMNRSDT